MNISRYIVLLLLFAAIPSHLFGQTIVPIGDVNISVPVGDTIQAGKIFVQRPSDCLNFINWGYTHNPKKDFTPFLSGNVVYFYFTPKKTGEQIDTVLLYYNWAGRCPNTPLTTGDSVIVTANATSDSISFLRFKGSYDPGYYTWNYNWSSDSNRYIADSGPVELEIINNVEDTSLFEFSLDVDSIWLLHSWMVIDNDSAQLPYTFKCPQKVRRVNASLYFFSDSKGYNTYEYFQATQKSVIRNSTTNDTVQLKHFFNFYPVPASSVSTSDPSEDIQIISFPTLSINTNMPATQTAHLQLFDILGTAHELPNSEIEIPTGEYSQKIETGNLSPGWYMLRVKLKNRIINKNFIFLR